MTPGTGPPSPDKEAAKGGPAGGKEELGAEEPSVDEASAEEPGEEEAGAEEGGRAVPDGRGPGG
ncbi:hypothetical protein Aph02nite_49490 [Actinoplanes philippinensis]|nr:hypothetical protein Aph02nite_49490 [Actinoplanes philippinensis]